jgi:hypothetical protein
LMSGFVRSETRKRLPPVYCAIPLAVVGVSCIRPTAPALDSALELNLLSASITAASSAGSRWSCDA